MSPTRTTPRPKNRSASLAIATLALAVAAALVNPTVTGAQTVADGPYAPFATASEFASQQYIDILRRQPSAEEVAYQANLLEEGRDPADLIVEIVESPEANSNIRAVVRLYRAYFLRNPDRRGLAHWIDQRQQGATLASISGEFARSGEFSIRYGVLEESEFVDFVYQRVMGRTADVKGKQYWLARLSSGLSRGGFMTLFSESDEYVARSWGETAAVTIYDGMLQRSISRGLSDYLGSALQEGQMTLLEVAVQMLEDPVYLNRF